MKRSLVTASAAGFAVALLVFGSHRAEAHNVCAVEPSPDGFVALRDKPSTNGKMVFSMDPGDMVVIEKRGYTLVRSGNWFRVSHYKGRVFPKATDPEYRNVHQGWVHSRYVGECG